MNTSYSPFVCAINSFSVLHADPPSISICRCLAFFLWLLLLLLCLGVRPQLGRCPVAGWHRSNLSDVNVFFWTCSDIRLPLVLLVRQCQQRFLLCCLEPLIPVSVVLAGGLPKLVICSCFFHHFPASPCPSSANCTTSRPRQLVNMTSMQ